MATITLNDIQSYAQITLNVEARLIDHHISLSRTIDLEPIVTKALMVAVDVAVAEETITKPELVDFYNNYIVPYWCLSAYNRFLASHGTNVTQFGLTVTQDNRGTFVQADEERRAVIMRQSNDDRKVFKTYMTDYLKSVEFTFDDVVFDESDTIDNRTNYINPIRKNERRRFNRSIDKFLD